MGSSPFLRVAVGVPLPLIRLYSPEGVVWRCRRGHERTDPAWNRCPVDGLPFVETEKLAPTDLYKKLLAWACGNEDRLWLRDGLIERPGAAPVFGLSEMPHNFSVLGLALPVSEKHTLLDSSEGYSVGVGAILLFSYAEKAAKFCERFGVTDAVQICVFGGTSY